MRYNQIEPNTEYATRRGTYVRTLAAIPEKPTHEKPTPSTDPWARSARGRAPASPRTAVPVITSEVDANGRPTGKAGETRVAAVEIAGLWADYLELHGDLVRWRAECAERTVEASQAKDRWLTQASSARRTFQPGVPANPSFGFGQPDPLEGVRLSASGISGSYREGSEPPVPAVGATLTINGPENVDKALKLLGFKPVFDPPKPARKRAPKA